MIIPTYKNLSASARFAARVPYVIVAALKTLLETRHLYQSVRVDPKLFHNGDPGRSDEWVYIQSESEQIFKKPWRFVGPDLPPPGPYDAARVGAQLLDFRAVCGRCKKSEPFNVVTITELANPKVASEQTYAVDAECQACKRKPETFLVARSGDRLTLCGRAPMEYIDVAKYFPEPIAKYVRDAVIAFNCGQTLAAIFFLRVAIEQWVRTYGATAEKADECIDWYMQQLPSDFKERYPSLRDVYSTLSEAIHRANASEPIYKQALQDIDRHFDARRLMRLPAKAEI